MGRGFLPPVLLQGMCRNC